ncbi:MAG: TetR/AcrR family transcriptional regulator [Pseudomonadota bacterium]
MAPRLDNTHRRKPRADAQKNRELLIKAAREVLGPGGPHASLEAVARRAGVGIGTLYRHFPNREALFHAVFSEDLDRLKELAQALDGSNDPIEALRGWLHDNVAMVETKRGMLGALSIVMTDVSKSAYTERADDMRAPVNRLLAQAIQAGQVRDGVSAEDLLQTMFALCYTRDPGPDWRDHVLKLMDIFVDGLRPPPSQDTAD